MKDVTGKTCFRVSLLVIAAVTLSAGSLAAQQPQAHSRSGMGAQSNAPGQGDFVSLCGGCHGLDGRGGERAPGIVANARVQRMSDDDISGIIVNGIPDTGMPAFRSLSPEQVRALVSYVRSLQGREKTEPLPGDPVRGKTIFFGKGECSSCHMVRGEGGFLGPDLSTYGSIRSARDIAGVLRDAARIPDPAFRMAVATTRNGHRLSGVVRNEDNFSVQLQTADGTFHFLPRADLRSFEYQREPAMPRDYGSRLDAKELDDLASYMVNAGRNAKPDSAAGDDDSHEDNFR